MKLSPKTKAVLGSLSRFVVTAGGVYLASHGVPPGSVELIVDAMQSHVAANPDATAVGATTAAGGLLWSLIEKLRRQPDTTNPPQS